MYFQVGRGTVDQMSQATADVLAYMTRMTKELHEEVSHGILEAVQLTDDSQEKRQCIVESDAPSDQTVA